MMRKAGILLAVLLLFCTCSVPDAPKEPPSVPTSAVTAAPVSEETVAFSETQAPAEEPTEAPTPTQDPTPEPSPEPTGLLGVRYLEKFTDEPILDEWSYSDDSMSLSVEKFTVYETYGPVQTYYVADIYVQDVTLLRAAAARGDFHHGYGKTVEEIAANVGALLAIGGDNYYGFEESLVYRNGELYRRKLTERADLCILYRDGRMETKHWGEYSLKSVAESDPWQVWSFGPALLDENGNAKTIRHALSAGNPRAAIGYYEPGHYCFVIVDGRQIVDGKDGHSEGMTLTELSRLMADLGCRTAYNLDGGGTAKLFWNGEIVSSSSNPKRKTSDIIYLAPAWMEPAPEPTNE
ncbi:MAG: phosphodiester glycosidase family protein [Clostridia bacterium]|nr:phosphodiester glycosidase family protein [Clostridia bacterium]